MQIITHKKGVRIRTKHVRNSTFFYTYLCTTFRIFATYKQTQQLCIKEKFL